jgi:hypothetical protein
LSGYRVSLRSSPLEEYARSVFRASGLALALLLLGCQLPLASSEQRVAPARPAAAPGGEACPEGAEAARATLPAPAQAVPLHAAGFCLDPNAPPRAFGPSVGASLALGCERLLGPGCGGLDGVLPELLVELRYVRPGAGSASAEGVLASFSDERRAYAHFTHAVLGEGDPADQPRRELDGGRIALGADDLIAWRGRSVLWLGYADEALTSVELQAAAETTLPELGRALLGPRGAAEELPPAVQHLPVEARLPLGVRLSLEDALGVLGLGSGAEGYHRDGRRRWRSLAIARPDAESAEDVLDTLKRQPDARVIQTTPLDVIEFGSRRGPGEPPVTWVLARRAEVVYGVGDDALALAAAPLGERALVQLNVQEKLSKLSGAQ